MAVGSATATAMLGALPGTLYVQAHSGEPGPAGTDNVIAGSTRGLATFPAAAGGIRSASGSSDCPGIPQGASVSHVSYWDALSGGTFRFSHALAVSVSFIYAGTLRFESQVLSVTTGATGSQTQTSVNVDSALAVDTNTTTRIVVHTDTATTSDSSGATVGIIDATTDTASTSDAVGVGHLIHLTDSASTADTVGISPDINETDTATTSDSNGATVGAFSGADDTATTSDSNAITQVFVSSNTDTATASDSNTAQEQSAGSGPTFVAAGAAVGSGTPVPLPTGWAENDILVIVAGSNAPAPSGYTQIVASQVSLYWKRAVASESSPTLSATSARMAAFRGCITTGDPFDVIGSVGSDGWAGNSSIAIPSVTTTVANTLLLAAAVQAGSAFTAISGTDAFLDTSSGNYTLGLGYTERASTGATGAGSASIASGEPDVTTIAGVHVALKPAA